MTPLLDLATTTDTPRPRAAAFAALWNRLHPHASTGADAIAAILLRLRAADGSDVVTYHASADAREAVGADAKGWPAKVAEKQRKLLAPRPGALFRFAVEGRPDVLEAFITDWSPFPAACALAVHPGHPLAAGLHGDAAFTGAFARHPIAGDLMPIWMASWVKSDFGTGVVIINPAHSEADLAFARQVGLPVRFGLWPEGLAQGQWPMPPVVRSGQAVRSVLADGRPATEAADVYLAALLASGHARNFTYCNPFAFPLGRFVANPAGRLQRTPEGQVVPRGDGPSEVGDLVLASWASTVVSAPPDGARPVLCSASDPPELILAARLLFADAHSRPLTPAPLQIVAEPTAVPELPAAERNLALLMGPADQPPSLKKALLEQVTAFLKTHQDLVSRWGNTSIPEAPEEGSVELKAARNLLAVGDADGAIGKLRAIQKTLKVLPADAAVPPTWAGYNILAATLIATIPLDSLAVG